MMNEGWIKVDRSMLDHHLFWEAPSGWLKVWLYLLLSANFTERKWFDGRQEILVPRGSAIASIAAIARDCHVTVKQVRLALAYFVRAGMVSRNGARHQSLISICNYNKYQSTLDSQGLAPGTAQGNAKGTPGAGQGRDPDPMRAPLKECKKEEGNTSPLWAEVEQWVPSRDGAGDGSLGAEPGLETREARMDPAPAQESVHKKTNTRTQKPPRLDSATEEVLDRVAGRIHGRHPAARRCGLAELKRSLRTIISKLPSQERIPKLEAIDRNHQMRCASEEWTKDDGKYAKGLDNWLAPTKGRYDVTPEKCEVAMAGLPEPKRLLM
jgi:hypothetical protein